jgi:diguanylate cyclase (GGDEF)-like protein/PAS domain S-box-containing protein
MLPPPSPPSQQGAPQASVEARSAGDPSAQAPAAVPATARRLLSAFRRLLIGSQRRLPLVVLVLGLGLTAAVAEQTRRLGQQSHEQIERALLDDVADAIEMKLKEVIDTINGVAGLFNASAEVDRREFSTYYETLRREENSLAGIQGIGFSRFLTAAQWPSQTAALRAEGFDDFTIRPPGPRPYGSAIVYLEPFDLRNQRAFGFDMYSEPVRRRAMDRAAQTGRASLSGQVQLVQEGTIDVQPGVLIYLPVCRQGTRTPPRSASQYSTTLQGWAYAPIRVGDLVQAALRTINNPVLAGSTVRVYDGDTVASSDLIFDNTRQQNRPSLGHAQYQPITVAGRRWRIGIQLSDQLIGPGGWSGQVLLVLVLGSMGTVIASLATAMLITNHLRTREALAIAEKANQERALAATVFEASPEAIVVTDSQGRVLSANQSFARITGYAGAEILGRSLNLLKSGRHEGDFYARLWEDARERGFWQGEIWNRLRSGEIRRHELSVTAVHDSALQISHFVGMLQDITDRHHAQELVRYRALHDELTGLPGRAMLQEKLNAALAVAERQGGHVGLLFLDLNGFKPVNDQYGHAIGDRVLRLVAQRLRAATHSEDLVARLGGDEFVILVPRAIGLEELQAFAQKIQAVIRLCSSEFDLPIAISASIGIALSPQHGISSGQLLDAADQAMYRSKQDDSHGITIARQVPTTLAAPGDDSQPGS